MTATTDLRPTWAPSLERERRAKRNGKPTGSAALVAALAKVAELSAEVSELKRQLAANGNGKPKRKPRRKSVNPPYEIGPNGRKYPVDTGGTSWASFFRRYPTVGAYLDAHPGGVGRRLGQGEGTEYHWPIPPEPLGWWLESFDGCVRRCTRCNRYEKKEHANGSRVCGCRDETP